MGRIQKIKYPTNETRFDPSTDLTLRYFNTQEVFVRHTEQGGYKLYCERGKYVPVFLARDNFLYIYPAFTPQYEPYVEAFLLEYAPQFTIEKAKQYIGRSHYEYLGNAEPVTL